MFCRDTLTMYHVVFVVVVTWYCILVEMTGAENIVLGALSGTDEARLIVVKTALVSVCDKAGLDVLGKCLASYGVKVNPAFSLWIHPNSVL